jgi:two-component system, cell cycle response regulator
MKILVADDDPTSRLIIQMALRSLGHECHTVADGAQAWDAFRWGRPDVVISDWIMPRINGLELCRKIREHATGQYTYFIMVSTQGGVDEILEGMSAGVDDYLIKPLDAADLHARLIAATRVTAVHHELANQRSALEQLNYELATIARRDHLTELGNRRALQEDLEGMEARVSRYGHSYCMALIDVDHFKEYNDTYGHQAGDLALQAIAAELSDQARGGDGLYRYGGEEFLCIFPEQSLETGTIAVERMREGVQHLATPHEHTELGVLTISAGLAILDPDGTSNTATEVLKEADEALYRAKQLGRNRVEHTVGQPACAT